MRNPNGYGSIYKLSGKRRKPYIVRKTIGWAEDGKQLYKTIGYYETKKDALAALAEYNKEPGSDRPNIKLKDLYMEWSDSKYDKITIKTQQTYETAWNHLSAIKDMMVKNIKKSHLQELIDIMDDNELSYSSIHKVKVLAKMIFDYALADDIVKKNYADLIDLPKKEVAKKEPFTDLEITAIETNAKNDKWVNTILILIYTGMRIGELLTLTKFNVDIDNMIITGGIKTDAGKDRTIPVHPKIQKYIREWYKTDGEYLINKDGRKIRTDYYRKFLYYPALKNITIRDLSPHSTRHTFASLINKAGANTKAIQEIIGHADYSTTANIYTHTDIEELRKAIEMI